MKTPIVTMLALVSVFFYKKEYEDATQFTATGYWKGSSNASAGINILNRADGTSRVYFLAGNLDTATAVKKLDGRYTVNNDVFRSHYADSAAIDFIDVQTSHTASNSMDGIFFLNTSRAFTFQAIKE